MMSEQSEMLPVNQSFGRRASDMLLESIRQQSIERNRMLESEAVGDREAQMIQIMRDVLVKFNVKKPRIDEIIDRWLLTREELTTIATDIGVINYEQALEASSILNGIPLIKDSSSSKPTPEVILASQSKKIIDLTVFNGYVPLAFLDEGNERKLVVAVSRPDKMHIASSQIRTSIKPVLMAEFDIVRIYRQYFSNVRNELDEIIKKATEGSKNESLSRTVLMYIIKYAAYNNANDLHLFKSVEGLGNVQITIDGVSSLLKTIPEWLFDAILNILILDNKKTDDIQFMHCPGTIMFNEPDIAIIGPEVINTLNFRLQLGNTSNHLNSRGKTAVIRLITKNSQNVSLANLGYSHKSMYELSDIINSSSGLFLVVGPTGSGKSTTLYSLMSTIDPIERSVVTIENPIEFQHGAWKQYTLLKNEGDSSEAEGYLDIFKSILRQAPKVALVGEIRDGQVANIAGQAANTGHLILATLHANSAASGIYRLINLGMDKEELALIFKGVLAQRLVRTLCEHCKVEDVENHHHVVEHMGNDYHADVKVFKATHGGCPHCAFTGYTGRKVVHELILADDNVKELIASGANAIEIEKKTLKGKGRPTLISEAYRLVAEGFTSVDEVRRAVL